MTRIDLFRFKFGMLIWRAKRPFVRLHQTFCGWFWGHDWKYEKEFHVCRDCKQTISGRDLSIQLTKGKRL